ncbi:hypothetical protein G6F56_005763 [Rhizopus delemar]|nr:hypothetical protein G6F56_005763 [Rhizopus delemar]
MLPNSQDILLYGGTADENIAVTDFIYTLNLVTNNWTEQTNINVPASVTQNGARFGHSAVLVNTTLFILFGKDLNGNPTPNLLTFDVANVSNIEYTPTYPLNPTEKSSSAKVLSDAALAGIITGAVILVIAVALGCFFFYKKTHTSEHEEDEDEMVMHVDWKVIEDQYREELPTGHYAQAYGQTLDAYSPHMQNPYNAHTNNAYIQKPHSPSVY